MMVSRSKKSHTENNANGGFQYFHKDNKFILLIM